MTGLLVALGAGLGSALRFLAARRYDGTLPRGTIGVNVAGSFVLGLLSGLALAPEVMVPLGTGFCGGLTTYSAFAVHVHGGGLRRGTVIAVLTLLPALVACAAGHALGTTL